MAPLKINALIADSYGDFPLSLQMIDRFLGWAPRCLREAKQALRRGRVEQARQRLRWLREAARFIRAGRIVIVIDPLLIWPSGQLVSNRYALFLRLSSEVNAIAAYRKNLTSDPTRPQRRLADELIST